MSLLSKEFNKTNLLIKLLVPVYIERIAEFNKIRSSNQ